MANKKNAFFNCTTGWTGVQPGMKFEYMPPDGHRRRQRMDRRKSAWNEDDVVEYLKAYYAVLARRFSRNICASPARPSTGTSSTSTSPPSSPARRSRKRRSTPPQRPGRRSPIATAATSRRCSTRPRSREATQRRVRGHASRTPIRAVSERGRRWRQRLGFGVWNAAERSSTRCFCPRSSGSSRSRSFRSSRSSASASRTMCWAKGITGYVGFANYIDVLTSDRFWHSILVTVIYVVVAVPIELVLGFLAAWLVNLGAPGTRTFRTIIGAPLFTLEVAIGYLGVTMFTDPGRPDRCAARLRSAYTSHGCRPPPAASPAAILLDVWRWTSFIFIIVLAGLSGISNDLYDAAVLDAKSHWQVMWQLAVPLAWPVTTIAVLLRTDRMPEGLRHSVRADLRRPGNQHRALQRHGLSDHHPVLRFRQGFGDGDRVPHHGLGGHHDFLQADAQDV